MNENELSDERSHSTRGLIFQFNSLREYNLIFKISAALYTVYVTGTC